MPDVAFLWNNNLLRGNPFILTYTLPDFERDLAYRIRDLSNGQMRAAAESVVKDGRSQRVIFVSYTKRAKEKTGTAIFYVEPMYALFAKGGAMDTIAQKTLEVSKKAIESVSNTSSGLESWSIQKNRLLLRAENPASIPADSGYVTVPWHGLKLLFYLPSDDHLPVFNVTKDIQGKWGVSTQEMYQTAMENMTRLAETKLEVSDLRPLFKEGLGSTGDLDPDWAVILKDTSFGFACVTCPDVLKRLGEQLGSFYILPFCRDEAVLKTADHVSDELTFALKKFMKTSNKREDPKWRANCLSNDIWFYDAETGAIHDL